jgi:hypothetical protein
MFIILGILVVCCAFILTLALAASASPVRSDSSLGNAVDEDHIKPLNFRERAIVTTHQGVPAGKAAVVSAAGMQ